MPRSVNAVASRARRKKVLKQAKGFFGRRKNVWTVAKNAVEKAMQYAYRGRKEKKRNFRALWISRINAGTRQYGISYSQFMGALKKNNIELNRKVIADLAIKHPDVFIDVVEKVKLCKTICYQYENLRFKSKVFIFLKRIKKRRLYIVSSRFYMIGLLIKSISNTYFSTRVSSTS